MSLLSRFFGKSPAQKPAPNEPAEHAVLVYLDGTGLPDRVYQEHDLATIETRLGEILQRQGLGGFDGNEMGPTETTLLMYGPDAERMFAAVEAALRDYPLCQGARVVIRRGGPGAPEREVRF